MAKATLPPINIESPDQMLLGALIEAQSAIKDEIKSMNENLFHGLEDESGKKLDIQTSLIAGGTKTKNLDSVSDNTKKTAEMASLNVDIAKTAEELANERAQKEEKANALLAASLSRFEKIKADFKGWTSNLTSLDDATSKVRSNFNKVTQGTGELGPMFNMFRDSMAKAQAGVLLFSNTLRAGVLGLGKFAKMLLTPFFGRTNKSIEDERDDRLKNDEELVRLRDEEAAAEANIDKVGKMKREIDVQFVNFVPEIYQNIFKIVSNAIQGKGAKKDGGLDMRTVSSKGFQDALRDRDNEIIEKRMDFTYAKTSAAQQIAMREDEIVSEAEEKKKKGGLRHIIGDDNFQKFRDKREDAFAFAREKRDKAYDKFRRKKLKAFDLFRRGKQIAFDTLRTTMQFLLNPTFLKIAALAGTFAYLKSQIDEFADAPFAGIAKAGDIIVKKVTSMFSSLRAGLAKIPGIGKFFEKKPPKPPVKPTTTAGKVAQGAKNVSKQALKRIPLLGAVAEGAIDATSNEKKFNKIKAAYEAGTPIMPVDPNDPEAGLRPMTAEEFAAAEQSMKGNRAGSVGRAGGAFAGAATGAAIGSVVPVIGTAVGGVIGAVLGGFFGGRAGDKVATNLVEKAEGIDDPQAYIDMLAANVPELQNEVANDLEAGRTELADATDMTGAGGGDSQTVVSTSSHTNNDIDITSSPDMMDQQMQYSYG